MENCGRFVKWNGFLCVVISEIVFTSHKIGSCGVFILQAFTPTLNLLVSPFDLIACFLYVCNKSHEDEV